MTLTTSQKIIIGFGDSIAGLGTIYAGERLVRSDAESMMIGSVAIFVGTIIALVAMFKSRPKPTNLVVISNIIYMCLGFLISVVGAFERNHVIVAGGIAVQLTGLVGMNLAVFKPGDIKAFNVINIICTGVGAALVLVGQIDATIKNKESVNLLGVLIVAVATTVTNITLYHKC